MKSQVNSNNNSRTSLMMICFSKKVRKKNYWEECRINLEKLRKKYEI